MGKGVVKLHPLEEEDRRQSSGPERKQKGGGGRVVSVHGPSILDCGRALGEATPATAVLAMMQRSAEKFGMARV